MHPVQVYGPTFVPPQPWLPIWADGVVPVTVLGGSGRIMLPVNNDIAGTLRRMRQGTIGTLSRRLPISWWSRPWLPPKRKMCGPSQNVLSASGRGSSV